METKHAIYDFIPAKSSIFCVPLFLVYLIAEFLHLKQMFLFGKRGTQNTEGLVVYDFHYSPE